MTYETILTARDCDVLIITLNRPERLNAASVRGPICKRAAMRRLRGAARPMPR
jgi:enoyl-CoA hydratase/carnithine racemase